MKCQRCASERILEASSHASDLHTVNLGGQERDGYLPDDLGIGGGDDLEIIVCLNCGQLQGTWPLPTTKMEVVVEGGWKCDHCLTVNTPEADFCEDCDADRPDDEEESFTWVCKKAKCKTKNDVDDGDECWKCGTKK